MKKFFNNFGLKCQITAPNGDVITIRHRDLKKMRENFAASDDIKQILADEFDMLGTNQKKELRLADVDLLEKVEAAFDNARLLDKDGALMSDADFFDRNGGNGRINGFHPHAIGLGYPETYKVYKVTKRFCL